MCTDHIFIHSPIDGHLDCFLILAIANNGSVNIYCHLVVVMSNSLWPHELQHTRLLCPPLYPTVYSNSCPLSWWCHPTISSSVIPFSSCPQSFLASGSFPVNRLFASGGQRIGASASASVLPMNIQGWFPLGLTGLTSLQPKGLSRVFSNTTVQKHQHFGTQLSLTCSINIELHISLWITAFIYFR